MDDDVYHVVIVGRSGGHPDSCIYLLGPGSKRSAIFTGEQAYRIDNEYISSIALQSKVVYSGTAEEGAAFISKVTDAMLIKEGSQ